MKKFLYSAGAFALSALPVLADDTSGGGTSTTVAGDVLESAQTSLEGLISAAGPVVSAVIVAGLGLWGAIAIVGIVKRAFNAGKGR